MNFLNPSAFWFLGFMIIPIIIHFLNRFKVKKVNFSTIQFIKELESSSIKRLKLEELFLLLIRILIILFLVILFANPVTKGFLPSWLVADQDSITIFVVDNSASMNALKDENSILDQVKKEIIKVIPLFNNQSKILVYQTCPPKEVFKGLFNDPVLKSSIKNIKKTSSFDNIWENINKFLDNEIIEQPIKECLIFSDFMYLPDQLEKNKSEKYKSWKFYLIHPESIIDNLSINSAVLLNRIKTINQLINLNVEIQNTGIINKKNSPLELMFNKQRVGQIITDVSPGKEKGFLFQAYPPSNGIVSGKFIIPNDNYEYDNTWHMAIPIMKQIKCAIIGANDQDIELLELLLESIDPENKFLIVESRKQPILNRLFLDQFDVAIIHNTQQITSEGVRDLEKFINTGGGIIWFQGNKDHKSYDENLFKKINFPKNTTVVNSGEGFFSVKNTDENSDLFQDVQLRDFNNQLPKVFNYSKILINPTHRVHWYLNNDDPLLIEFHRKAGTIFYFSTLLDLKWNDLPIRGLIVPLIYKMLVLTGTEEINTLSITIDESKWMPIKEKDLRKKWEVKSPSGFNRLIVPDYDKEGILISDTDELGLFNVYSDGELFTSFPTRLHKLEYIKSIINSNSLENLISKENIRWLPLNFDLKNNLLELRNGKSLWRFILIIIIVLVILETIIGRPDPKRMKVEN
jgi:hypothetical protein